MAPVRVETGSLGDSRRFSAFQILCAVAGWLLVVALIGFLAFHASSPAVRTTFFLATVALVVALIATFIAVDLLRRPLIRARSAPVRPLRGDPRHDALGRAVDTIGAESLAGEFTIVRTGDTRRYAS